MQNDRVEEPLHTEQEIFPATSTQVPLPQAQLPHDAYSPQPDSDTPHEPLTCHQPR
jgi:hypothetical protein